MSAWNAYFDPAEPRANKHGITTGLQSHNISRSSLSSGFDLIEEEFNEVDNHQILPECHKLGNNFTPAPKVFNSKASLKSTDQPAAATDMSISTWKRTNYADVTGSRLHTIASGSLLGSDGRGYFFDTSKPSEFDARVFFPEEEKPKKFKRVLIEHDLDLHSEDNYRDTTKVVNPTLASNTDTKKFTTSSPLYHTDFSTIEPKHQPELVTSDFQDSSLNKPELTQHQQGGPHVLASSTSNTNSQPKWSRLPDRYRLSKRPSKPLFGNDRGQEGGSPSGLQILSYGNSKSQKKETLKFSQTAQIAEPFILQRNKPSRVRLLISGEGINIDDDRVPKIEAWKDKVISKMEIHVNEFATQRLISPRCNTLPSEIPSPKRKWHDVNSNAPRVPERKKKMVHDQPNPSQTATLSQAKPAKISEPKQELIETMVENPVHSENTGEEEGAKFSNKLGFLHQKQSISTFAYPFASIISKSENSLPSVKTWIPLEKTLGPFGATSRMPAEQLNTLVEKPNQDGSGSQNKSGITVIAAQAGLSPPLVSKPYWQIIPAAARRQNTVAQVFPESAKHKPQPVQSQELLRLFRKISSLTKPASGPKPSSLPQQVRGSGPSRSLRGETKAFRIIGDSSRRG